QPMAGKLLDAGHELWIFDVSEVAMKPLLDRQARKAASPKVLADTCEIVVVSLPTLAIFDRALKGPDGLLAGSAIKTLVNTCTVGGPFIRDVEAQCAARGVTVIDAPISGGASGAKAGTLAVMVSGDPSKVSELMPIFRLWGPTIVVAGEKPGAAQAMKLTNNMLYAVAIVATSEAMMMSAKAGVPDAKMLDVLNAGTGRNFATMQLFPNAIVPRTFESGATIDVLLKDVDLAIEQGEELGIPMWVCQAARLVIQHGAGLGRGQQDLSRIFQIVEEGAQRKV
ncbi:MAG: NAD(P)-dependent oxidoreductase, partial [Hyphomicrobiaceae bacterium]|nr:NAD(P)-dependent oxidoreductase [Hyphomicrobiaceae bacterium]